MKFLYKSSSSSFDPFSPPLPIVHRFQQVFRATPHILTELLYVGSSWSPCLARFCEGVHRSTLLMSSSLLLQQCPACPVPPTLIVFVMGGWWAYSFCFVGCCFEDLFNIARSIFGKLPSSFFSIRFVSVHVVHPYCFEETAFHFIGQV